jgi:5-methylcytosine-specific restriction endonuclease McrA
MTKKGKKTEIRVDGLSPKDMAKVRSAIRRVWSFSYPRRLCVNRSKLPDHYFRCELCKLKVPKVTIDHIIPLGSIDGDFLERLFCPSIGLQALCHPCHKAKTKIDNENTRKKKKLLSRF